MINSGYIKLSDLTAKWGLFLSGILSESFLLPTENGLLFLL
jgi:hypothetical protein